MKTKLKKHVMKKFIPKQEIQLNPYSNVWPCCWDAEANGSDNGYKLEKPFNTR